MRQTHHVRSGIPEALKEEIISNSSLDWETGLSYKRFFRIVQDAWISQLRLQEHRELMNMIRDVPEEAPQPFSLRSQF